MVWPLLGGFLFFDDSGSQGVAVGYCGYPWLVPAALI
jgi:hypothetical protein